MFSAEQKTLLSAPLSKANVKGRKQAGRQVSYIEGWKVIEEANRIFGFDNWTRETIELRMVSEGARKIGDAKRDGWGVSYIAKVRIVVFAGDTLVTREGVGAGHGIDIDLGQAHESAVKESETDAMKRGLMTFGNPFGLALYDKEQANVAEPEDESKLLFLGRCEANINALQTEEAVKAWWSSPERDKEFALHRLTDAEIERLKTLATARRKGLVTTKAAA